MSGPEIAIIMDNPNVSNTLRVMLDDAGYAVRVHAHSNEALAQFASAPPAVVVHFSDHKQTDGPEFAREFRRQFSVPIIFISTDTSVIETALSDDSFNGIIYMPLEEFSERNFVEQVARVYCPSEA